jgi:hypothetical protein
MDFALLEKTSLALLTAFILGGIIGFERQWRQRTAGLRTNVLVAVGSCRFRRSRISCGRCRWGFTGNIVCCVGHRLFRSWCHNERRRPNSWHQHGRHTLGIGIGSGRRLRWKRAIGRGRIGGSICLGGKYATAPRSELRKSPSDQPQEHGSGLSNPRHM